MIDDKIIDKKLQYDNNRGVYKQYQNNITILLR